MASSSDSQKIPFAGKWADFTVANDGEKFVPEPSTDKAKREIWQSQ
ncbi:hypothetical protein A2U01_0015402, partial [Trifolium medium]|nr:hypothetical protein [Trifolium medium]